MTSNHRVGRRSFATALLRGIRLRCPRCGGGRVRASWFATAKRCPHCAVALDRGERDYWYGSYALNFVAAEVLAVALVFGWAIAVWPEVNWTALTVAGIGLAIVLPAITYPFAQMLWLAVDFHFRPYEPGDGPTS